MSVQPINRAIASQLLLALGATRDDLPAYRYSQLMRGGIEAYVRYGKKDAADIMLRAGMGVKMTIKLLGIAVRRG